MEQKNGTDFAELKAKFEKLKPGQRAEVRRARDPSELSLIPAYYRVLPEGVKSDARWRRIVFFLPYASHKEDGDNIGAQLAKAKKVSEMRVFQMARSEGDTALQHLRRLCQHVDATVDWNRFGKTLFYWGDNAKKKIVEDYFMSGGGK
ncbi:MAG: type I-E CRISPR-associated protein Cse2/CasB [Polyangia bacterium]